MKKLMTRVGNLLARLRSGIRQVFLEPSLPSSVETTSELPVQPLSGWILFVGAGSVALLGFFLWLLFAAGLYVPFGMILALTTLLLVVLLIHIPNSWVLRGWRWYRRTNRIMIDTRFTPATLRPAYRKLVPAVYIVELLVILSMALSVTEPYRDFDDSQRLGGIEQEWLTSSGAQASLNIHEKGYVSLWQPYLEYGEPLVENPFSFVFNPLSSVPSLLYGGVNGIKVSVVVYVLFTGLGGWMLGHVLGFSSVGRVFLALLLIGKGNMHAMLEEGYFQLGVSQAYMPWIVAGAIASIRHWQERWSPVLLAVMMMLLFFAGNIWYTLPMIVSVVLLAVTHLPLFQGKIINFPMIRRLLWAGLLTLGLTAIILIPIWERRDLIGDHPPVLDGGREVDLDAVIEQFYNGDELQYYDDRAPGDLKTNNRHIFYYSYVAPLWFLILMFGMILPIQPFLYVPGIRQGWRIWIVGIVMIVFCTLWGAGQNPAMKWAYERVELLGQWRFVGRALAVASFWLAVLVAMRVDGLVQAIVHPYWRQKSLRRVLVIAIQCSLLLAFVDTAYSAAGEVNEKWNVFGDTTKIDNLDVVCVEWLRSQYPDEPLTVYRPGYNVVYPYLDYHVRQFGIEADFRMLPQPFTIGENDLTRMWPRFAVAWDDSQREAVERVGYAPVVGSPRPQGGTRYCLYDRDGALPYAFSIPIEEIQNMPKREGNETFDFSRFSPIVSVEHAIDRVRLQTNGDSQNELVVSASELAYPGWQVVVNGEDAEIESVGGQIGVVLPVGNIPYSIEFIYRPTMVYRYGVVSVGAMVFCILYLIRIERLFSYLRRRRASQSVDTGAQN
jgi:hypothetical protein